MKANSGSKNVLVVDDSADDIFLLQLAARSGSEDILFGSARDAEEAKQYLLRTGKFSDQRRYPFPDLILLDLNMPRRDGLQFLDWLRGTSEFANLKVIAWTGLDDEEAIERARVVGAGRVVRRPENREEFVTLIGELAKEIDPTV